MYKPLAQPTKPDKNMFQIGAATKSEFELQSDIYQSLKERGINVRGEVKGSVSGVKTGKESGNKVRLDIVIFHDKDCRKPFFVIEVKPSRSKKWESDYKNISPQYQLYRNLGLPVLMVCGEAQSKIFLADPFKYFALPNGINWLSAP